MKTSLYSYLITGLLILSLTACSSEKQQQAQSPEPVSEQEQPSEIAKPDWSYISIDAEAVKEWKRGEGYELVISEPESDTLQLKVRRAQEMLPGVWSVAADITDSETGLASLVVKGGKLSGTLDLYAEPELYFIRYDSLQLRYYIEKRNREDLDILPDSDAPKIPKNN